MELIEMLTSHNIILISVDHLQEQDAIQSNIKYENVKVTGLSTPSDRDLASSNDLPPL